MGEEEAGGGDPALLVAREHDGSTMNCTNIGCPWQWGEASVFLGEGRSLVVNYYSLRHGDGDGSWRLQAWVLEGSNDGINWIVMMAHTNDDSLPDQGYSEAAWKVEGAAQACRHFRIRMTGKNSSRSDHLHLAGIELYGRLATIE